jgi:hypothetical protein
MMVKREEQDVINAEHAANPKVGDYWQERFAPILVVTEVTPETVVFCSEIEEMDGCRWTWALQNKKVSTRQDFTKKLRYENRDGFWADCYPEHMKWVTTHDRNSETY